MLHCKASGCEVIFYFTDIADTKSVMQSLKVAIWRRKVQDLFLKNELFLFNFLNQFMKTFIFICRS